MANMMPGQLRVANDIDARPRVDTSLGPLPDTGIQQAAAAAAGEFAGLGARIGQMADKAAAKEGFEAGRIAGLDPEFRTANNGTIRGDAFDKAALDVADTRLRQQVDADFDGAFLKHANDAADLHNALAMHRAAILQNAPPELQPGLDQLMTVKKLQFSRELARKAAAEAKAAAQGALETQLNNDLKGLHQRAYALGLDAQADTVLSADVAAMVKTLARRGPDGARLVSPEAAAKQIDAVQETVATARLSGAFQRLPTVEAKAEFIKQFDADFAGSKGLAQVYDLQGFERVKGMLEADYRAAKVERSVQSRAVAEEVTSLAKMAEKGYAPSPADLAGLKSKVASAGDPEVAAALQQAEATLQFQAAARRLPPADLDRFVQSENARMRTAGANAVAVDRVDMAEKLLSTMRGELKQDPLAWADRVGLIKVAPIDVSSQQATSASLKARVAQAEEVASYYGQDPKYLRPDEVQGLATFAAQGADQALGVAAMLAEAGGDRAPKILGEVFDKAPGVAMLGGHVAAAGITPVARDAAGGMALQKTEGFKPVAPSADVARTEAVAVAGSALQALPKSEAAAITLANAAYEVRARRLGLTDFDAAEWQSAFREVLGEQTIGGDVYGGVTEIGGGLFSGGNSVIVPPNIKQDGFADLIDAIRIDDLTAAGGVPLTADDRPVSLALLRRAQLVQVGDGQFQLALSDDPQDRQWFKNGRGSEYVLDLKALEPMLRKRRPDLYLGGQ